MRFKFSNNLYKYFFIATIILIAISLYIEKKYSPSFPKIENYDYAQINKKIVQQSIDQSKGRLNYQIDIASKDVFSTEAIKLIKEKQIEDISEKPIDPFTQLAELAREKRKTYVMLKESDLNKKIAPNQSSFEKLKVMEYNPSSSTSHMSPLYAPCDFAIFKTSSSWENFKSSHKIREEINVDFSKENVIVITSKSELPPGIFKITNVTYQNDTAIINYTIDVLEMAENNPHAKANFYTATTILKKSKTIKLNQTR